MREKAVYTYPLYRPDIVDLTEVPRTCEESLIDVAGRSDYTRGKIFPVNPREIRCFSRLPHRSRYIYHNYSALKFAKRYVTNEHVYYLRD